MNKARLRKLNKDTYINLNMPMCRKKARNIKILKTSYGVGFWIAWCSTYYTNNEMGC